MAPRQERPHLTLLPLNAPPIHTADDAALVARLGRGDEQALAAVYDRHAGLAYSLAMAMLQERADAEEAVADAFAYLWRSPGSFDASRGSLQAWITMLVRSRALDRLRARKRAAKFVAPAGDASAELAVADAPDETITPDDSAVASDRRARVEAALDELPLAQREALRLAYFEGLSQSEIAERLQEPLGTVKTRMRTALGRLRQMLAPLQAQGDL